MDTRQSKGGNTEKNNKSERVSFRSDIVICEVILLSAESEELADTVRFGYFIGRLSPKIYTTEEALAQRLLQIRSKVVARSVVAHAEESPAQNKTHNLEQTPTTKSCVGVAKAKRSVKS